MELRGYQSKIIDEVREHLRAGRRRILIQLATGGGKTAISAFMARGIIRNRKSMWFNCHRDFLLEQTSKTFDNVGIAHGFISAGLPYNKHRSVQLCGVGTVTRRLDRLRQPDYIIWDETKHIAAASWKRIFEWAPDAIHIGLDATPWRLDGRGLGDYYEVMVQGPTVSELMEAGYLSRYIAYAPSAPNLAGVHTVAGDYNRGELGAVMDDGQIIGDMVRHYREKADGRKAVYFAVSVEHSRHIAATFSRAGIAGIHLDGNSSADERRQSCAAFARGEVKVISSVDILGEGFDVAAMSGIDTAVECVGLARPTQSLSLHLQQIGRALRPQQRPAIILDHAGNCMRHGLPDDDREWSLEGRAKPRKGGGGGPPVRQCEQCFGVHAAAASSCPYCGHIHVVVGGREVEEISGELIQLERTELQRHQDFVAAKIEERQCKSLSDWQALARKRGHKPGWAYFRYQAKQGRKRA